MEIFRRKVLFEDPGMSLEAPKLERGDGLGDALDTALSMDLHDHPA